MSGSTRPGTTEHGRGPAGQDERLLERGVLASRVLLLRGIAFRAISVATSVGLIALVGPAELGLLAVVRAAFGALQLGSELGFEVALVRRRAEPTPSELSAVTGLRVLLLGGFVVIAAVSAPVRTLGGLVPAELEPLMLLALGVFMVTSLQSTCRIRLERRLEFGRLSVIEVNGLFLQNAGVVAFASLGHFSEGVLVVQMATSLYVTAALCLATSLVRPSFDLRHLRSAWRESIGFTATAVLAMVRDSGTPLAIGKLFGLEIAGLWAFSVRVAQQALVALEGYARAGLPVAAQLTGTAHALRRFGSRMLRDSASLTLPLAALAYVWLPVVGLLLPHWQEGIRMAQLYLVAASLLGVVTTATWLVAVARRGASASIGEQLAWILATGVALLLLHLAGGENVVLAIVAGGVAGAAYLLRSAGSDRPDLRQLAALPLGALIAGILVQHGAWALGWDGLAAAAVASLPPVLALGSALGRGLPLGRRVHAPREDPAVSS